MKIKNEKSVPGAIIAMAQLKCPRCRKGPMFQYRLLENPAKFNLMHEQCPVCQQHYYPEIGFYTGAMYFSYAINTAIIITAFVFTLNVFNLGVWGLIASVLTPVLLLFPINFRLSRALMLHAFGNILFDPDKAAQ